MSRLRDKLLGREQRIASIVNPPTTVLGEYAPGHTPLRIAQAKAWADEDIASARDDLLIEFAKAIIPRLLADKEEVRESEIVIAVGWTLAEMTVAEYERRLRAEKEGS